MWTNYLKIAWRNLLKHRTHSVVNILGLSMGIACCLLMMLWVRHELSYDQFHRKKDRIYRVVSTQKTGDVVTTSVETPMAFASTFRDEFPEVERAIQFGRGWSGVLQHGTGQYHESGLFFTEPAVFDLFDIEMTSGDPKTALSAKNSLVITETIARKYFGDENPLGKTMMFTFEGAQEFEVTGVVRPMPEQAHFHFDFLAPFASQPRYVEMMSPMWQFNVIPTYLLLKKNTDPLALEERLSGFVSRHYPEPLKQNTQLSLQALTDIHLNSRHEGEIEANGSMRSVWFFSGIAAIILLIACINFMNLSTARSAERAREVGVRKTMGALKRHLVHQFFGEAFLIVFIAIGAALLLAKLLLPAFNGLTGKSLILWPGGSGWTLAALAGLGLLVGVVAGSYPAFYLSAFRPVKVLKGLTTSGRGVQQLRKFLVVGQFAVSVFFLIAIAVIYSQLSYLQNQPLGYNKDQVIYIRTPQRNEPMNFEIWRRELTAVPGVLEATGVANVPGAGHELFPMQAHGEGMDLSARIEIVPNWVEHDFAETFELRFAEGVDFYPEMPREPVQTLIINETAARALGWKDGAVGKELSVYRPDREEPLIKGRVTGVLKDFHFESLHVPLKPLVLTNQPVFNRTFIALRVDGADLPNTLAGIDEAWKKLAPEWPIELSFLDQSLAQLYAKEQQMGRVAGYVTFLAIFIACLGLFGLAAYATEQRTKEIGIRKILGATAAGIVGLLSRDFLKLVLLAVVIGSPAAWYFMDKWLDEFAYRIGIGWWVFALAGLLCIGIAFVTVGFQSLKAALANPATSLKNE